MSGVDQATASLVAQQMVSRHATVNAPTVQPQE